MQLITVKELSKIIKVKESTLYAWANKGLIPCHKLNNLLRFDLDEIETWIRDGVEVLDKICHNFVTMQRKGANQIWLTP